MTETGLAAMQRLLLLRYDDFKARLTRRLGSAELAGDALQDTWLRLERGEGIAAVHSHDAYIFRIAINIARDRQRVENRRLTTNEIETLLNLADEAPDSARIVGFGGGSEEPARQQTDTRRRSENDPDYDPNSAFQLLGNGDLTPEQQKKLTEGERSKFRRIGQNTTL